MDDSVHIGVFRINKKTRKKCRRSTSSCSTKSTMWTTPKACMYSPSYP